MKHSDVPDFPEFPEFGELSASERKFIIEKMIETSMNRPDPKVEIVRVIAIMVIILAALAAVVLIWGF